MLPRTHTHWMLIHQPIWHSILPPSHLLARGGESRSTIYRSHSTKYANLVGELAVDRACRRPAPIIDGDRMNRKIGSREGLHREGGKDGYSPPQLTPPWQDHNNATP